MRVLCGCSPMWVYASGVGCCWGGVRRAREDNVEAEVLQFLKFGFLGVSVGWAGSDLRVEVVRLYVKTLSRRRSSSAFSK